MRAYLQRLTQHLASFVAIEQSHKARIRPANARSPWGVLDGVASIDVWNLNTLRSTSLLRRNACGR